MRRLLVPVLVLGLVAGGSAIGLASVSDDIRLIAAHAALDTLRSDVVAASTVIDGLARVVSDVEVDLADLRDGLAAADVELKTRERALERRSEIATDVVTTGRTPKGPAGPLTVADLRAPMQIVGRAIHANDMLTTELVGQQLGMRAQVASVRELLTRVRQTEFRLATQERVVRAELTEAMRSAATIAQASGSEELARQADELIAAARSQLHRIDLAREGLRLRESEVLERSIALDDRDGSLRGDLRRARQSKKDLFGQMAVAEIIVGSRLAAWTGPFDGMSEFVLGGVFNVCPVDQPMSYSDNWHAPRWGGGFHLHQGIDIFAPIGTPIRAPFDGLAVTADNWLGGIAVKVYGEAGYVYNAHLSGYGQLGQVEAGTIIGYVGETGNASGPHDHFEFHPGGGDAVNPFGMLSAVC